MKPDPDLDSSVTDIDRSQQNVAVMFSGGTDSMLAAAMGAETFREVHLVTYRVPQMSHVEKSRKAAQTLIDHFGADKISHQIVDNGGLFRKLYLGQYLRDLRRYGLYLNCTVCMSCGLAFRVRSIVYCRTRGCRFLWDGLQTEGAEMHVYPLLNPEWQQKVVDFCGEFDVIKESPVLHVSRTDHLLYEKGITAKKDLKLRALGTAGMEGEDYTQQLEDWHDTQADCVGNVVGLTYLVGAFVPRHGHERNNQLAYRYQLERMDIARDLLNRFFAGELIPYLEIP